jgi:hypothetical protein
MPSQYEVRAGLPTQRSPHSTFDRSGVRTIVASSHQFEAADPELRKHAASFIRLRAFEDERKPVISDASAHERGGDAKRSFVAKQNDRTAERREGE